MENTSKKKICFVAPFAYSIFYPEQKGDLGGAEVQLYLLATTLAKNEDYDVSFIVADIGQKEDVRLHLRLLKAFPVKPQTGMRRLTLTIVAPFLLWKALRRANADVYVQRSAGPETGIMAFFTRCYRRKFVYMVAHERECNKSYCAYLGWVWPLFHYGLHHADQVLVQHSEQQEMLLKNEHLKTEIFRTVYPIPPAMSSISQRQYIFYQARLVEWKKPDLFLRLAELFPQENFLLIGNPRSAYGQQIVEKAKLLPNVHYFSFVPFDEIEKYFREAKIFVSTSVHEGFPNTFVQSCREGVPIASLSVNPEGFITREQCGFYADGEFEKLVFSVKHLLDNEKDYERMSQNAFRYAQKNHNITKGIEHFRKFLATF